MRTQAEIEADIDKVEKEIEKSCLCCVYILEEELDDLIKEMLEVNPDWFNEE